MAQMPAVSNSSTVRRTFSPLPQPWSASTSSARLPARQIRLAWPANSVKVSTTRSGAPSTDIDPIEPENIPTSKPRSSAMRAEIASYTDPGCTQRLPERIARKRSRRSVQFMMSRSSQVFGMFSRAVSISWPQQGQREDIMEKRIAVIGAGAIGGYTGGQLAHNGFDVTLIDPWPEHIETIRQD